MNWNSRKCEERGLPFFWSNAALCIEAKPDRFNAEMVRVEISVAVDRPAVLRSICCVTVEKKRARSLCWLAMMFGKFVETPMMKRFEDAAPRGHEPTAENSDRVD